jgi:hypothetical protein
MGFVLAILVMVVAVLVLIGAVAGTFQVTWLCIAALALAILVGSSVPWTWPWQR